MPHFIVNLPQTVEADDANDAARRAWAELDRPHMWAFDVQELDSTWTPMDTTLVLGEQL